MWWLGACCPPLLGSPPDPVDPGDSAPTESTAHTGSATGDTGGLGCPGFEIGQCWTPMDGATVVEGSAEMRIGAWLLAGDSDGDGVDELWVGSGAECGAPMMIRDVTDGLLDDLRTAVVDTCADSSSDMGPASLADVTGDALPELLVDDGDDLRIFAGPFVDDVDAPLATLTGARRGAIGDLDHDGVADLVFTDGIWFGPLAGTVDVTDLDAIIDDRDWYASLTVLDPDHDGWDNLVELPCCGEFVYDYLKVVDAPVARGPLDSLPGYSVYGAAHPVGTVPDLTGDGLDDIVVRRLWSHDDWDLVLDNPVWVADHLEGAPIDTIAHTTFPPATPYDRPEDVAAGDFDGDGATDIAIALGNRVVVHRGPLAEGEVPEVDATVVWVGPQGATWFETEYGDGYSTPDGFGASVAAGDFDGDGRADLAIGAPAAEDGGANAGRVYVLWGGGLRARSE